MSKERWKPIPEFPHYAVSTHGRVKRVVISKSSNGGFHPLTILRPLRSGRYLYVRLYRDKRWKHIGIHRLVWLAFTGEWSTRRLCINHKDGNPLHNHLSNLERVSKRNDALHAYRLGLSHACKGEANGNSRLSVQQVRVIRESFAKQHQTLVEAGRRFGVSDTTISNIVNRKQWKHLP